MSDDAGYARADVRTTERALGIDATWRLFARQSALVTEEQMSESKERISAGTVGEVLKGEGLTLLKRTKDGKTEHVIEITAEQHGRLQDKQDASG